MMKLLLQDTMHSMQRMGNTEWIQNEMKPFQEPFSADHN